MNRILNGAMPIAATIALLLSHDLPNFADEPSRRARPISLSVELETDNSQFISRMPNALARSIEQHLAVKLVNTSITINPFFDQAPKPPMPFLQMGNRAREDATNAKKTFTCHFNQLLVGGDKEDIYGVGIFLFKKTESQEMAIVSVEVKLTRTLDSEQASLGQAKWSGPYIGNWQHIKGFDNQDITKLLETRQRGEIGPADK